MKRIAILFGGASTEYEVSLQSASAVIEHLNRDKYEPLFIGITRQGEWLLYDGPLEKIRDDAWHQDSSCVPAIISPSRKNGAEEQRGCVVTFDGELRRLISIDAAFPMLHGKNGEDGTLQGLLEMAGIPVVGCKTLSSAICMDKEIAHNLVAAAGISVPKAFTLRKNDKGKRDWKALCKELGYPLFVKPARAGSSFGVTQVTEEKDLEQAIDNAFIHDTKVVVEKGVDGFEVGCAVLGNEKLTVGRVDEIELSQGFFDYTEKYTLKTSKIHMPARIDEVTEERIRRTAETIYRTLECEGFARVDMFLTPEKEILFNEVNTIPGFTAHSRYPNMMKGIGKGFEEVIDELIQLAIKK